MVAEIEILQSCSGGVQCFQNLNGHEPAYSKINGHIYPPSCTAEKLQSAKDLSPRETDIFVCTYPKSGTTWIQYILVQLLYKDRLKLGEGKELFTFSPMLDSVGAEGVEPLQDPRILKTHFPYEDVPKTQNGAKYIYCLRNPKDVLVSFYHHLRNFKPYHFENGDFNIVFEMFTSGRFYYGDYFQHIVNWTENKAGLNILFLKYEDMLQDLEGTVKRIGEFLGGDAADLVHDEQTLSEIVANSRFSSMKKDPERWFPTNLQFEPVFMRKGTTRDWTNELTKEQSDVIDQLFERECNGTKVEKWWREEMRWE